VVDQAIDGGEGHGGVTEHLAMPRRSIGESLRLRSLTHGIPFMGTAIRSATDALGGDRH
jgi:hypothetical protein